MFSSDPVTVLNGLVAIFDPGYYLVGPEGLVVNVDYTVWGWIHLIIGLAVFATGLGLFARSLGREDRVALEVTGNAWPAGHGAPDPQFEITGGWKSVRTVVDVGGGTGQAAERFARFFGHTNLHCHSIDHRRHLDRAQRGFSPHRPGAWRPPTTSRLVEARGTTHSRPRR